jgi:DNA polymerase III subunit delta'
MLDQLTGNDRVKQLLRRILETGRSPGAMLFAGEDGVGKKLFALEIAKALNCRSPEGAEACGQCPSCVRIGKINYPQSSESDDWKGIIWTDHPDVGMVVAPKRVLLVEQMRLIEREANYRPYEGKARLFLVEDADTQRRLGKRASESSGRAAAYVAHRAVDFTARDATANHSLALPDDPLLAARSDGD